MSQPFRPTVLVVGGSGGIGAACCRTLAAEWHVVVADIDLATARDLAGEVGGAAVALDVADIDAIEARIGGIEAASGAIAGLVFAAGLVPAPISPEAAGTDEWDRLFAVNSRGAYAVCRAVGRRMAGRGYGAMVLIASLAGMVSTPHTIYGPSKAAMLNLAASLAVHWGRDGIRVNTVCPGPVRTPIMEASYARGERDPAQLAAHTALGRVIEPSEVAAAIAFLLSNAASAITGTNLVIDAGMSAALPWNMFGGVEHAREAMKAR